MRVSREKAAENRQKIIETAARLFRERGFDGVGVDTIMEGAGLTHGGFYGHFKSKDDLAAEAIVHALVLGGAYQDRFTTLEDFVGDYLSEPHRTALGSGCAVAALSGDIVRQNAKLRSGLAAHLRRQFERDDCRHGWRACPRARGRRSGISERNSGRGAQRVRQRRYGVKDFVKPLHTAS
jgi:TetR/AcrR family transcriptional regulator, transcriptional repressor for nem operon